MPAIAGLVQRSYTWTTGKKFSSYGRSSGMMRSAGQNEDRNYEVRLNSFSDGTAKFHGYNVPREDVGTKPPPSVKVEPAVRSSFETDGPVTLSLSPEVEQSRMIILQASQELNDLLQGPRDLLFNHQVHTQFLNTTSNQT